MAKSPNMTPSFDLFTKSKELVVKNWKVFGLLYLPSLLYALNTGLHSSNNRSVSFAGYEVSSSSFELKASIVGLVLVFFLAFVVIEALIQILLQILTYRTAKGEQPSLPELWQDAKKYGWRLIKLWIRVGFYILGGLLLFIVPGIIMIRKYFLSSYYLLDRDLTSKEAMRQSAEDSSKYSGAIWGVLGVGVVLAFAGVIPVLGGLIAAALAGLYSVAPAMRYFEIKKAS